MLGRRPRREGPKVKQFSEQHGASRRRGGAGRYRARQAAGATEERDQAVKERDEAKGERDDALRERGEALRKRDQALVKRADALGKLITAHEAGRVVGLSLQAVTKERDEFKKKLETAREDRDADWEPFLDYQVDKAKSAGLSEGRHASAAELKTRTQERDQARETAAVNEEVMEEMLGQRDTAVNELGVDQAQVETLTAERDQAREERDQVREERDVLSGNVDAVVDVVKALEPNRLDLNRAMAAARLTKSYSGWLAGAVERGRGQVR